MHHDNYKYFSFGAIFGSIGAELGMMYLWLPLGIAMFCIAGLAFLAFCGVHVWRWVNG
ncbi:MAG: hypothetical protein ACI4UV_09020 [Victivallales bacterium]